MHLSVLKKYFNLSSRKIKLEKIVKIDINQSYTSKKTIIKYGFIVFNNIN